MLDTRESLGQINAKLDQGEALYQRMSETVDRNVELTNTIKPLAEKLNALSEMVDDHEDAIVSINKAKWWALGIAAGGGTAAGTSSSSWIKALLLKIAS